MLDQEVEQWRDIPGWEGLYSISDRGRVKSHDHVGLQKHCGGTMARHMHLGCDRKLLLDKRSGYYRIGLYRGGRHKFRFVHHLVLEAFVGPRPLNYDACHNDGCPTNNNLNNLRWDTKSANMRDMVMHGTNVDNRGERCGTSKLITPQVYEIRAKLDSGLGTLRLAREYSVSPALIRKIRSRKCWAHLP